MITIIASFNVKPECVEAFHAMAMECVAASRKEDGNSSYHLYTGKNDNTKFFFVENWKDDNAIQLHNASEHFMKFAGAFMPLVTEAPIIAQTIEQIQRNRAVQIQPVAAFPQTKFPVGKKLCCRGKFAACLPDSACRNRTDAVIGQQIEQQTCFTVSGFTDHQSFDGQMCLS